MTDTMTKTDIEAAADLIVSRLQELETALARACRNADLALTFNRDEAKHSDLYWEMCHLYDMRSLLISDTADLLTKMRNKGLLSGDIPALIEAIAAGTIRHDGDGSQR